MTPDDHALEASQDFSADRAPAAALDAAQIYLEGAGIVAPPLHGELERKGNHLVIHHGRVTTNVKVSAKGKGSKVVVRRKGQGPLENTRRWLFGIGILGFFLAWGLSWYNSRAQEALPPLVTMTLFFLAIFGVIVGLYVVDRSLEHRSQSLIWSLQDAMQGDPFAVLKREIDGLEKASAVVNGLLAYCIGLILGFIGLAVTYGVGDAVDRAVALDLMPANFGLPVIPALLVGGIYFAIVNKTHAERLEQVARRFKRK